jgi:predicted aldo/keto reductase-like oxidoreductase
MKREKNHRKIFFNLEKKRAHDKLWTKIKTSDGNDKEDISSILEKQIKYYQNLFTSDGWDTLPNISPVI